MDEINLNTDEENSKSSGSKRKCVDPLEIDKEKITKMEVGETSKIDNDSESNERQLKLIVKKMDNIEMDTDNSNDDASYNSTDEESDTNSDYSEDSDSSVERNNGNSNQPQPQPGHSRSMDQLDEVQATINGLPWKSARNIILLHLCEISSRSVELFRRYLQTNIFLDMLMFAFIILKRTSTPYRHKLSVESCEKIVGLHKIIKKMYFQDKPEESYTKTASMVGLSEDRVKKILNKYGGENNPISIKQKEMYQLDEDMKTAIRKKIYDFYLRGEPAYKDKVFKDINDDPMLPYFKMRLFDRMLNHFKMFTLNKRANYALIDRMRISVNRIEYLQKLKELRAQKRCFYYLDELFLPAENTEDKNQPSTSAKKKPTQKYMVIAHIGNENGFIDDGLGVFHVDIEPSSRNKIETNQFEEWFEKILPKLEKNSVILMDSAPYHIRKPDIIPNWQWSTKDIESWFSTSGLEYYENSSKVLLLHTIKEAKIEQPPFIIDTMAMKYNIEIIRTPQFHYDLNPINVIWAEIKKIVAKRTLNIEHLREIVDSVICDKSSIEKWRTSIQYVLDLEENYYGKLDGAMDDVVDSNLDESEEADGPNEYPAENQAIYLYSGSDDCIWENVITDLSEIGTDTDSSYVYYDKSIFNYVFISPASRKSS